MSDLDEELPAIRAGDADAFGRWLAGAEPRVRASLTSFAAKVDTEAVLQESFLRVWQVAPRFTPDDKPEALLRFAVRVARNLAVDETRRQGRWSRAELDDVLRAGEGVHEEPLPDPLLRELIHECRRALPKKPALVLEARLNDRGGRADRDLAPLLQMTVDAFAQNISRARKLLRECLTRKGVSLEVAAKGGAS